MYEIGSNLVEIPFNVMNKLLKWNEVPLKDLPQTDKCFALALLFVLVEQEDILNVEINRDVMQFVQGKYLLSGIISLYIANICTHT